MKPNERPARFLIRHAMRRPWSFGALLLMVALAAACAVGVQVTMKFIVDAMSLGASHAGASIWRWLGLFMFFIGCESVCWRLSGWLGCRTVVATGVDMRLDLFGHLTGQSADFFGRQLSGALGNRITATAGASGAIYGALVWRILPPATDFIGAVLVALTIDLRMAATLIGFVGIVSVLITLFGIRGRSLHQRFAEQGARVGGELVDVVNNIWNVKAFSARDAEYQRLEASFGVEAAAHRRSWHYLEKTRVLHDMCLVAMAALMLSWAIHGWTTGRVTPGEVVLLSALTFRILHGSRDLALSLVECSQQFGVVREMLGVIAVPHALDDAPAPVIAPVQRGELRFERVHFVYDRKAQAPVLDRLDLWVPAGQRLGLVGPSGAGKSTLVGLLQRLADPQGGRILIDGVPIRDMAQDTLRAAIAVVPQEVLLFHRSLMENIRYGRPDASDEEVFAAARHARCTQFIDALPLGYETLVGERGTLLSGGQRQRVGIARALLKNAPIVVLDEATSALDSLSEAEIQAALAQLMKGRTVIAVAHRLATVSGLDRVVVLDAGRIVEDGTPDQLRQGAGLFAAMWRLQAEGFETD